MKLSPLIVALDVDHLKNVESLVRKLGPAVDFYKVGMKLFTHYGPEVLRFLRKKRKKIFLDLKFHDIPNTVGEACREAVRQGVHMMTLHASGGSEMMKFAARAVNEEAKSRKIPKPFVMGVTVLTSMDNLDELGIRVSPSKQVLRLADLAVRSRLDGVICSPLEIQALRKRVPRNFKIVTPGVRPSGSPLGDQKRVKTPEEAYRLGADALVVGRPIIQSKRPVEVVQGIFQARLQVRFGGKNPR